MSMTMNQVKTALPILMRNNIVPFIWGTQGIGKTEMVRQAAKDAGMGFVALYLGTQADMGDLLGLLVQKPDGTVGHARPEWLPVDGDNNPETGIIFLDEFNRAHPDVLQGMYSFLLSKTIHTHTLKKGWSIVAAGNYENANFTVNSISDSALLSRLCHIDFKPSVEEFVDYAETVRNAHSVAAFIREQPGCIDDSKQSFDFTQVKCDRRAMLERIGRLEAEPMDDSLRFLLYQGSVGTAVASAFMTFKKKAEKALSINDILKNYDKVRERVQAAAAPSGNKEAARFDLLNTAASELMTKLDSNKDLLKNSKQLENVKQFILDIPVELGTKMFEDMKKRNFTGKDAILNDPSFCDQITAKLSRKAE